MTAPAPRADQAALRFEHDDHRDCIGAVEVDGPNDAQWVNGDGEVVDGPPLYPETHALIYTDGCVALTLHECCYYLWGVSDGAPLGGSIQHAHERLSEASRPEIAKRAGYDEPTRAQLLADRAALAGEAARLRAAAEAARAYIAANVAYTRMHDALHDRIDEPTVADRDAVDYARLEYASDAAFAALDAALAALPGGGT